MTEAHSPQHPIARLTAAARGGIERNKGFQKSKVRTPLMGAPFTML